MRGGNTPAPIKQNVGTGMERVGQSKARITESRTLIKKSRLMRLTSIATFTAKSRKRAAAAKSGKRHPKNASS